MFLIFFLKKKMSYGAINTELPIYNDSRNDVQTSRKTFSTSFAEFLESVRLYWSILGLIIIDIVALTTVVMIKLDDIFINILLKLILVINITFVVDVLLRLIVFGPIYFCKGKHGILHGFDAFLALATLGVQLFLDIKEVELVEISLLLLRCLRIFIKHVKVIEYKYPAFHIVLVMDRSGSMNGKNRYFLKILTIIFLNDI